MNINDRIKVKKIAELTDINDHCASLRLGLTLLNKNDVRESLENRLSVVEASQEFLGYLTHEMYRERFSIYSAFKGEAIKTYGQEDYSKIYGAF